MSDGKNSLLDLQSRLTTRLDAARTSEVAISWLAAQIGGQRFLFPLSQMGEIFPWSSIRHVPYTQGWFLGVTNLRGSISGVVDLPAFLDPAGVAPRGSHEISAGASMLAVNPLLEVNVAFLADNLAGLRNSTSFVSMEAPAADAPSWRGAVYTTANGERWQEIDVQKLVSAQEFLGIGI